MIALALLHPAAHVGAQSAGVAGRQGTEAALRPDSLLMEQVGRDRARFRDLVGMRSEPAAPTTAPGGEVYLPALRVVRNSAIPFTGNDGALWAGRGVNLAVSGGVAGRVTAGGVTVQGTLMPVVTRSGNRPFQVIPGAGEGRSGFSSPWHAGSESADLPLRFGTNAFTALDPGETGVRVSGRGVAGGVGWMSRWWGPGIRNALVLGNNAGSIPQVHVGTDAPLRMRAGELSALLMAGTLTESAFFDMNAGNDFRSLSGLHVEFRPAHVDDLTLGFSRLSMRRSGGGLPVARILDALIRWDNPPAGETPESDQLLSLSARWAFPASGFAVHGEWARTIPPRSLRDGLLATHYSQGYTIGTEWAVAVPRPSDRVRLQAEVTYLEQSRVEGKVAPSYYVGRATEHGFTQRGQVIGAAIGPGGSAQWLAADYIAPGWQAGTFLGRTRWENDRMYAQPAANFYKHDVTLQWGVRGAYRHRWSDVAGDLTVGRRLNYLFQSAFGVPGGYRNVDISNVTLSLSVTPRQLVGTAKRPPRAETSSVTPSTSTAATP